MKLPGKGRLARFARPGRRATLAKQPAEVAGMFDQVARRYDLMNSLTSLGQDSYWRLATVDAIHPVAGELILDLAAGTGSSSKPLVKAGCRVIACDLSLGMVQEGRRRQPKIDFVLGDALHLPFADGSFDAATISFGLRNVADTHQALAELHRVVRPDGSLVICEFSTPPIPGFRGLYHFWLKRVLPATAHLASADPAAYSYLTESILDWPNQKGLAHLLEQAGWADIEWRNLSGGIVALHRARRPA